MFVLYFELKQYFDIYSSSTRRHICSLRLTVADSKGVRNPYLKTSQVYLWVQLTMGNDTTQHGSTKKFVVQRTWVTNSIFKTHNTVQCGLNKNLQSILNSIANATLDLILNNYFRF